MAAKKDRKGDEAPPPAPIIIKKIQGEEHGAHGGAWKIALADMMTAMMAFFLLMWLLGATTESQRKSIADYFKPTPKSLVQMGQLAGSNGVLGGRSIMDPEGLPAAASQTSLFDLQSPKAPQGEGEQEAEGKAESKDQILADDAKREAAAAQDRQNFDAVEQELREKLRSSSLLAGLQGQVNITREKDGLRIEVLDKSDFSMFGSGAAKMTPRAQMLVDEIARSVAGMPNKVTVRGHTDSLPFSGADARTNWSLSAERAESMRQILEKRGVTPDRFASIEGVADTDPFTPGDRADPRNRRISVTLKNLQ